MDDHSQGTPRHGTLRRIADHALARARGALEGETPMPAEFRQAGLKVLVRAEHVMTRLDGVAATLDRAAQLQLGLIERLAPVVDDLAELVRHTLDEARARRGLGPKSSETEEEIIDVEATITRVVNPDIKR